MRWRHEPNGGQTERQVRSEAQRALLALTCLSAGTWLPCRVAAVLQATQDSLHYICAAEHACGAAT